jgi:DNA modification methylase
MAVINQEITERYALYHADCNDVMTTLPDGKIALSIYSPPFGTATGGLYKYSSSDRDLSNCVDYTTFMDHYRFVVKSLHRITMPGRISLVHCIDIPSGNTGTDELTDFPGDIIRMHKDEGWSYIGRYCVWKEPLGVRNRTMTKSLAHASLIADSSRCSNASADYLLAFRRSGENTVPIHHPTGLMDYAGFRRPPVDILRYRGWSGDQIENKYSQWVWRQYASAFWDDVRIERVLPFRDAKDENDERHVHPLQLDVIDRGVTLWSNPGEVVFTPFMGVGSEVYGAVRLGRLGIGCELKPTYFVQSQRNMAAVDRVERDQASMDLGDAEVLYDFIGSAKPDLTTDRRTQ